MDSKIKYFLDNFFYLNIENKIVRIPYWRNKLNLKKAKRIQGPFGGKGSPGQIKSATLQKAKKLNVNLKKMTAKQIEEFMKQNRIGIDCSGFVFQFLNQLKPGFWKKLKKAPGISNNPVRRFNASALTSDQNSFRVNGKISEIKVGDIIPVGLKNGKATHVMVVIDVTPEEITYAHSSSKTQIEGPHLGKIIIDYPNEPLHKQRWEEKLASGKSILSLAKEPLAKIGIRRIKGF